MTDSTVYSSLFALVDSHLSKTSVQDNGGDTKDNKYMKIPPSQSESLLPSQPFRRFPVSPFDTSESSIKNVLAEQVANMLKAKEIKKQEQEKLKIEEEMKLLEIENEQNTVIDLMSAIQNPFDPEFILLPEESLSSSSSCESLFKLHLNENNDEIKKTKTLAPLPCITDMSYILNQKFKRSKGSSFGKVLSSRLRPVPVPYLRQPYPTDIIKFDFKTPSPCDVIKENLRKPTMSCTFTFNLEDY